MSMLNGASEKVVMVTGATGYIGGRLAQVLAGKGTRLILPVRASSPDEFSRKSRRLSESLGPSADAKFIWWDLATEPAESIEEIRDHVSHIVHCAAVTRFNVPEAEANEQNLSASQRLFEFARTCSRLEHFLYVSTVYVSGSQVGHVPEAPLLTRPEFANHYERSKWETEATLFGKYDDLPWNIARVATVICDDSTGVTGQFNAVHNTLKLFYYGLISLIPGLQQTPIYLVTGEFVAQALASCLDSKERRGVWHVCRQRQESLTLGRLIDIAHDIYSTFPDYQHRRIQKPLFVDQESFSLLSSGVSGFGGAVLNEALSSVTPFAKQLYVDKDFENNRLQFTWPAYGNEDMQRTVENLVRYLVTTRWGKTKEGSNVANERT